MKSALYIGRVSHLRTTPAYRFARRLRMVAVEVNETDSLRDAGLLGRFSFAFRRRDYLDGTDRPLADEVRDRVERRAGWRPTGPIVLVTQLRHFGLCFDPVRFYYCLSHDRRALDAVLVEVTNTPWNERFEYVVAAPNAEEAQASLTLETPKLFHVSPFMGMRREYRFRFSVPDAHLRASIESRKDEKVDFVAALELAHVPWTRASMRRSQLRFPWMPAQVLLSIYVHALRLWLIGARFHSHPRYDTPAIDTSEVSR